MEDRMQHLLRLKGLLERASELVDHLANGTPASEDARVVLTIAADAINTALPRTRKEVRHFAEAIQRGDEAWLVVRSIPTEHRIDAVYATKLSAATRKTLGI